MEAVELVRRAVQRRRGSDGRQRARRRACCLALAALAIACLLGGPASAVAAAPPSDDLAPEVVGVPQLGERIVCAAGSWSGIVSEFRYSWVRDGIAVASGVAYFVSNADKGHSLWCVVTAVGPGGSTQATSSNSFHIPGEGETPPVDTVPPSVSGVAALGQTLSCAHGTWSAKPEATYAYQWLRDGIPIEGATSSTYLTVEADAGHALSCRVTATNSAGQSSALSSNSLAMPGIQPQNLVAPRVLGVEPAQVGEVLSCSTGVWRASPDPTFSYQWVLDRGQAGEAVIHGATAGTLLVEAGDRLHTLSCTVTARNSEGAGEARSSNAIRVAGTPPEVTEAPQISGTRAVGQTLTCLEGGWSGAPAPTFSFLWLRNQGMAGEEAIGASRTYVLVAEDVGKPVSCEVTASNSEGHASASSAPVVVPKGGGSPPHEGQAPRVEGQVGLGRTLTCSEGNWSGSPEPQLSVQWLRDSLAIAGATASTYTIAEADEGHSLACRVTAVNDEGVASATSTAVAVPGQPPEAIEAPQVSGTPAVGHQLACLPGRWSGAPSPALAYQWLRDGSQIPAATASVYVVASEDRGRVLSCRVTATNVAGTAEAVSTGVEVPGGVPENLSAPQLSGVPAVGQTLSCSAGTWDAAPPPAFAYQWLLSGVEIPGATTSAITVEGADRGYVISCRVTASNVLGSEAAFSAGVAIPGLRPESVEPPQVSGTPTVGQTLSCLHGVWSAAPPPAFAYQWLRDGVGIASATAGTYIAQLEDAGHRISCRVTATNGEGRGERDSWNSLQIGLSTSLAGKPETVFPSSAGPAAVPSSAELKAAIASQLKRAGRRVRLSALRRSGLFSFSFSPLTPGTLQVFWYHASAEASRAGGTAIVRQQLIAAATSSFTTAATRMVRLRLTAAGRRLIAHSSHLTVMVRGVFRPHGHPVSWTGKLVLGS